VTTQLQLTNIIVTELSKVLSQEMKCLFSKTTTVLWERILSKTMDVPYIFIAL